MKKIKNREKVQIFNSKKYFSAKMDFARRIYEDWNDLMDNKSDPRTTNWPLMSSPFPTMFIILGYLYVVKVCSHNFFDLDRLNNFKKIILLSGAGPTAHAKSKSFQASKNSHYLQLHACIAKLLFIF